MLLAILPRNIVDRYPHRCPGEGCAVCAFVAGYREVPLTRVVINGVVMTCSAVQVRAMGPDWRDPRPAVTVKHPRELVLT